MAVIVLFSSQLVKVSLQAVRLDLVLFITIISPLPFADVKDGEEDTKDNDSSQEQREALQRSKRAIVLVLWVP